MATTRVLSREDGVLDASTLVTSRSRLYSDLDLTFEAKPSGDIYIKKDAAAVKQAVKNIIQTNFFEKPFQPFFGADIRSLLFELANDETGEDIKDQIIRAIEQFEPRARIIDVIVDAQPANNSIKATIEFQVVNSEEVVIFTTFISRLR